nr:hypothetical protein [Candidatus Sigynarchaeota archaeon]
MKVSTRAVLHFTAKAGPWRAACDSNFLNVSGTVVDPGLDRNEFANDQTVVYVSTSIDETIELPSTLAIVAGDIPDDVLVSIPFASVAMKILRAIEPVLGLNILVNGSDPASLILTRLLVRAGASVYYNVKSDEELRHVKSKILHDDDIQFAKNYIPPGASNKARYDALVTMDLPDALVGLVREHPDLFIRKKIVSLSQPSAKTSNELARLHDLDFHALACTDVGLDDDNYMKGYIYPAGYVRWHFKENLAYFISLAKQGAITLDSTGYKTIAVNSVAEIKELMPSQLDPCVLYKVTAR